MSNLSELLPTGGGQNAVDFVASGTLSSGQAVALNSNGTVSAITSNNDPQAGSPEVFDSNSVSYTNVAFDSSNNKIIVSYRDNTTGYGMAVVGTISGESISFGTPVTFASASTFFTNTVYDVANNKTVIVFRDGADNQYGKAIVGTVSGNSISFGTEALFAAEYSSFINACYDDTNNKIFVVYREQSNFYGKCAVGSVSGTSISFTTPVIFNSANTNNISCAYNSAEQRAVVAYRNSGNSNYGTANVIRISGSIVFQVGAATVFNTSATAYTSVVYDSSTTKTIIAYQDSGNSNYGAAVVGTVGGTSISFGTPVVFASVSTAYEAASYNANSGTIFIAYTDLDDSFNGKVLQGSVSGTSISFGNTVGFSPTTYSTEISSTYDASAQRVVLAYKQAINGNLGTAVVIAPTSSNNTDFIGITAGAISDTATGAVNVYGGINEAQTGLTIGSDYYVQADGSLSTTASDVKVGQAISATTINMMDLT